LIWLSFCHPAGAVFTNATGMDPTIGGGQVAWGDYNNDGFVDLSVVGVLHRNNGGTSFTRMGNYGSSGIWGDYDNDDWLDFFSYDTGELFHNEGGTSFTSISLPEPGDSVYECVDPASQYTLFGRLATTRTRRYVGRF
jgi:hypothetical protein